MDPIAEAYLHSLTYHSMVDALERIAAKHDPENAMGRFNVADPDSYRPWRNRRRLADGLLHRFK